MREAWGLVEANAHDLHALTSDDLREGKPFDRERFSREVIPILDRMVEVSEQLRREGDSALKGTQGAEYEQISELLLAAAAVDAMFARDAVALDADAEYERSEDPLEEDASPERVFEEGQMLLEEANRLFGEEHQSISGRCPGANRQTLTEEVERVTAGLVNLAEPPASDLIKGLLAAAGGGAVEFLSAAQDLDVVSTLEKRAQALGKHAPRFLREHVAKIATLRSDGAIVDLMAEQIAGRAEKWVAEQVSVEPLLNFVSASQDAVERAVRGVNNAAEIGQNEGEALLAALTDLETGYGRHMHWIGKSARWLRRGARPLMYLGTVAIGPLSLAIGAGVFFVGISYVGYSLTDRLDARSLGFADRVEGVIRLVDLHIPA